MPRGGYLPLAKRSGFMPAATEQRMTVTDYKHAFAKVSQAYRNLKKSGQAEWEDLGQRGMVQLMSGVAGVSVGAARAFLGDATTGDISVGGSHECDFARPGD